ncbi:MAG: DUF1700 domain-containing protein [Coprobacillus sp.]
MSRQEFMKELKYLLQDISDDERAEALSFYEDYFDEAGVDNEDKVIAELGEPSRVAAIIKDGLRGQFDDHINVGNQGFSSDNYQKNYEVIDVDAKESKRQKSSKTSHSGFRQKWDDLASGDRIILIVIALFAFIPFSFSIFGGLFGAGFSVFAVFFSLIFGFWIITIGLYIAAIVLIVTGVIQLFTFPGAGLICIGIGSLLIGLAHIFGRIAGWFFRDAIPGVFNAISDGLAKIFNRKEAQS